MAGFDWNELGNDIRDLVQDAINTRDFDKLNGDITRTIQQALDGMGSSVREAGKAAGKAMDEAARNLKQQSEQSTGQTAGTGTYQQGQNPKRWSAAPGRINQPKQVPVQRSPLFVSTSGKKAVGILMAAGGYTLASLFAILLIVMLALLIGGSWAILEILISICLLGLPLIGTILLGANGTLRIGQVQRFRSYIRVLGGRAFCDLKELAAATGKSISYVRRDLSRMIEKNWFLEGHLDKQETCLIVTNGMYQKYLQAEHQRELRLQEEQKKAEEQGHIPAQVQEVLEAGEAYIKRIRKCNDDIPGEEISAKIDRIEGLVRQIFARVKEHPEMVSDIRKMMEYYLPTTIKLLDAYAQLDAQSVQGEHITSSKQEIEEVLDTLNVAFEKLLDGLFRDAAWDVSADISVLETMLAQEGLTNDEFRRASK